VEKEQWKPGAPEGAPAGEAHAQRDWIPRWAILLGFLIVLIILAASMYESWRYRTVIKRAKQAMVEERWSDALSLWARHVRNYPGAANAVPLIRDRAVCYLGAGNFPQALADVHTLLAKDPDNVELLELKAQAQSKLGQANEARLTYEKILQLSKYNAKANLFIGNLLFEEGKILEAARYFQSVPVTLFPEDMKMRWNDVEERLMLEVEAVVREDLPTSATPETPKPTDATRDPASPPATPSGG
jgi:tetratricopeptide (TPR) repeat protein